MPCLPKKQNKKAGKALAEEIENLKEQYSKIEGWIDEYDELLTSTIPELEDEVTQLALEQKLNFKLKNLN